MNIKYIVTIVMVIGLTACGASGPYYTQYTPLNSNSAVVYIYRLKRSVNCCVSPIVYLNEGKKDHLKNGGYLAYELPVGKHSITVGDGAHGFTPATLELDVVEGEHYYIKWNIGAIENIGEIVSVSLLGGVVPGQRDYNLVPVKQSVAKREIISLKLSAQ